jgi:trans-2,3-dihydro-3-hydroxyanthranilate isomerase
MPDYAFETVDVFTERRFGGNPLAVFTDARGLSKEQMQALAFEFNLSETTFILPPENAANTARVRIFNRTAEMTFAGHPSIGTAYVMARGGPASGDELRLEVPAGIVAVALERDGEGEVVGGRITAPQPLSTSLELPAAVIAACLTLTATDVVVTTHRPITASVGVPFVLAEVRPDAIARCAPDITAFRSAVNSGLAEAGRLSLFVYAREGADIHARMFAPVAGTWEDPATGSASATLAALLLRCSSEEQAAFTVRQGAEMGRPSRLHATAARRGGEIIATVAGRCVPVMRGHVQV